MHEIDRDSYFNDDGEEEEEYMPLVADAVEEVEGEKRGKLTCNGKTLKSEVIYWKEVPGDLEYERYAITPNPPNVPNSPNSVYVVRSLRTTASTMTGRHAINH